MNINIEITKPLHKEFNLQVKLFHASIAIAYCTKNSGVNIVVTCRGSTLGLGNLFATTIGNSNLNITILVFKKTLINAFPQFSGKIKMLDYDLKNDSVSFICGNVI